MLRVLLTSARPTLGGALMIERQGEHAGVALTHWHVFQVFDGVRAGQVAVTTLTSLRRVNALAIEALLDGLELM